MYLKFYFFFLFSKQVPYKDECFLINHYKVYKEDTETGTNSHIRPLTHEERINEIANMLSGATLTEAALNNAKALLNNEIL